MTSRISGAYRQNMRFSLAIGRASASIIASLVFLSSCRDATGLGPPGVRGKWYQPQSGWARARPAVVGNTVYFGDGYGEVIARDVASGERKWTARIGQERVDGVN